MESEQVLRLVRDTIMGYYAACTPSPCEEPVFPRHEEYDAFFDRTTLNFAGGLHVNTTFLVVFIILAAILCIILSGLSQVLSRNIIQDAEKRSTYECGFSPHDSATRAPFDVHYYIVGIMFLIFDVEIALIFPFASCAEELEWLAYANMAIFLIVLTIGYAYEWVRGALLWAVKLISDFSSRRSLSDSRWVSVLFVISIMH